MDKIEVYEVNSIYDYINHILNVPNYANKIFNIDKLRDITKEVNSFQTEVIEYNKQKESIEIGKRNKIENDLKNRLYRIIKYYHVYPLLYSFVIRITKRPSNKRDEDFILESETGTLEYYYRGVYNGKDFNLLPSCFRKGLYGKESQLYRYVKAKCFNDLIYKNHLDTLVTMQHYDCPTRLLDITFNPLVALYFACKNYKCDSCEKADYGYVYVFANEKKNLLFSDSHKALMISCLSKLSNEDQIRLHDACVNAILTEGLGAVFDSKNRIPIVNKFYHEILNESNFEKRIVAIDLLKSYFVHANSLNKRIDKQSGAFLISGVSKNPDEVLEKIECNVICKFKINNQKQILEELDLLNVNDASLFPELDKVSGYYVSKIKGE